MNEGAEGDQEGAHLRVPQEAEEAGARETEGRQKSQGRFQAAKAGFRVEGPQRGPSFQTYITEILAPSL